jgi:hypothetical protein
MLSGLKPERRWACRGAGISGGMPHWQPWSSSPAVEIPIKKGLELASVFPIALEAKVMVMRFEPELFDIPTAT